MRVLVCGSRTWSDRDLIMKELSKLPKDTVIIEGEARGADSLAASVAEELGFAIMRFPADWDRYGKRAGWLRNQQMLTEGNPDRVIAFTDDLQKSIGTNNMVTLSRRAQKPVDVIGHDEVARGELQK